MGATSVEDRVRAIAARVAAERGLELVHVEFAASGRTMVIRIFIDKPPEGVTHEDCSAVSLDLGTILDVEDFIHSAYTLEVSSPGLERGLYTLEDFRRYTGQLAKLKSREAINGQRNFRGRIAEVEDNVVIFDDNTNGRVRVPFGTIVKANLEIDIEQEFRLAEERERQKKRMSDA
ncbi:MAG: ribosome maturation factor RimP [Pyrinomonadaceae bacterium]|nr:ribosome maturation factor RimP [Pyrinomonadaceae bacterium]